MASAGRILIMPKGGWAAETEYEMLDLVAHNGRAWVAKKASVGIEPSEENAEYWHDFLGMDVFTEANPPTAEQVGTYGKAYIDAIPVNNNILINSNFANPVNQRGVTAETWSHTSTTGRYGLDRWKMSDCDVSSITNGLTLKGHGNNASDLMQIIESGIKTGEKYSVSICVDGVIYSGTVTASENNGQVAFNDSILKGELVHISTGYYVLRIRFLDTNSHVISWVKLELGDHATPYVPRLYAEELELCKRYFDKYALTLFPYQLGSNSIMFSGDFRNIMRITPTVTANFEMYVNGEMPSGFTFEVGYKNTNNVFFKALKTSHGHDFASGIKLIAYVCVDAEL